MNKKSIILLLPLLLLVSCKGKDKYKDLLLKGDADVFLICGQSNASGNSPWSYLAEKDPEIYNKFSQGVTNVLTAYDNVIKEKNNYFEPTKFGFGDSSKLFGPEIGMADVFSKGEGTTYIIKYAIGGSQLHSQWLNSNFKRGNYYNGSIKFIKEKIKYLKKNGVNPRIRGMFWMQGESDSFDPVNPYYQQNLTSLVNFFKEDLKDYFADHFTFVDAYICTHTVWWDYTSVNNAKQIIADSNPHNFVIKTNGEDETALNLKLKIDSNEGDDAAHYDSLSELALGRAAATILLND